MIESLDRRRATSESNRHRHCIATGSASPLLTRRFEVELPASSHDVCYGCHLCVSSPYGPTTGGFVEQPQPPPPPPPPCCSAGGGVTTGGCLCVRAADVAAEAAATLTSLASADSSRARHCLQYAAITSPAAKRKTKVTIVPSTPAASTLAATPTTVEARVVRTTPGVLLLLKSTCACSLKPS